MDHSGVFVLLLFVYGLVGGLVCLPCFVLLFYFVFFFCLGDFCSSIGVLRNNLKSDW